MIEVNRLTYTYPSERRQVLHGLDFCIGKGEIFGFLGPSGAGKSTTQNVLIGKLQRYGGSVQVFGRELKSMGTDYYERIGVAFEFPNFFSRFSALENLKHFRSLYKSCSTDPLALLEQVGLQHAAHMKVEQFSKGMKMRLNYCRSVLNNPDILFLDEPTSGLDPVNADLLMQLIRERQAAGTTVLITTHNMQAAELLCDRVAFIADGRIRLIDTPQNLRLRSGERKVRVEYERGKKRFTEDFPLEKLGENSRYLNLIRSDRIVTMHTLEASLDQVFMDVTGRTLR